MEVNEALANSQRDPHKKRPLRRVVAVFKTHFDLGFTDLPDRVMAFYTGPMFDAVMGVMRATASEPPDLQYKWTLPAWPMR
jgi:alpha-mannosidase